MKEFMIDCDLPEVQDEVFMSKVPAQQHRVQELFKEGSLTSYMVSLDRAKLWMTLIAEDEEHAMEILSSFPMINYFRIDVSELMFHNAARVILPALSLN